MNRDYECLFKLVIVGDSGVGKSSLLLRFADDSFNDTYLTTIGVDFRFRTLNVDGKNLKLQIWDTAGQERFRTITNAYYKGADGIIMVYDTTNQSTFDNMENYWMKEVESYGQEGVEVVLIGNKVDVKGSEEGVKRETAESYAKEKGMQFAECSAKTAEGVTDAFLELTRKLMAKRQKAIEAGKLRNGSGRPRPEKVTTNLEVNTETVKTNLNSCCN